MAVVPIAVADEVIFCPGCLEQYLNGLFERKVVNLNADGVKQMACSPTGDGYPAFITQSPEKGFKRRFQSIYGNDVPLGDLSSILVKTPCRGGAWLDRHEVV